MAAHARGGYLHELAHVDLAVLVDVDLTEDLVQHRLVDTTSLPLCSEVK